MLKCKRAESENTNTLILNEGPQFLSNSIFERKYRWSTELAHRIELIRRTAASPSWLGAC